MKTRTAAVMALLLVPGGAAFAHEAGSHSKVMGTVRSIDDREIVVETTGGKQRSIRIDDDTECMDESGDSTCSEVKPGNRVVVTTRGKEGATVADEVRFSSRAKKTSDEPQHREPRRGHEHAHGGHEHSDEGDME
ncbi:MAG: hypothetical protein ACREQQ_02955 [Candidatus Binatia bacterium]